MQPTIKHATFIMTMSFFCRLFCLIALACLGACQNNPNADKLATTANPSSNAAANNNSASANPSDDPRGAISELLRACTKVEYMVYDAGITFESEGSNEVLRFLSYVTNTASGSGCPPDKYDGNAVFKNTQGEIKFQVQFNLPAVSNCNRVTFSHNNQTYHRTIDPNGIGFFGQVLNMRNQVGQ